MFGLKKLTTDDARNGVNTAYTSVMNHPRTTAAVVLGTGAAAAIWWVLRNPQRVAALRKQIAERTETFRQSRQARQQRQLGA